MYLLHCLILLLLATVSLGQAPADSSPTGPTLPGTASNCNRWYKIKKGDGCDSVQKSFGISAKDFFAWNPDVSSDCLKNFWVDNAYCVGVGPVSSGSHSHSPSPSPITTSSDKTSHPSSSSPWSPHPSASGPTSYTFNHPITSPPPLPPPPTETAWKTQAGQPKGCYRWHKVQYGETCRKIAIRYSLITLDEFIAWNPEAAVDCDNLFAGWQVCVGVSQPISFPTPITGPVDPPEPSPWTPSTLRPFTWPTTLPPNFTLPGPYTLTAMPTSNVQVNTTKDCRAWYQIDYYETCQNVVNLFGTFSMQDFLAWNPTLGKDCKGIQNYFWYCVAVPGTPASRTAPRPELPEPTGLLRQPGVAPNCNRWWVVLRFDTCDKIVYRNDIGFEDFHKWNPAISWPSCKGLRRDSEVCVGVANNETITSSSWPPPPYPTGWNSTSHVPMTSSSRLPPSIPPVCPSGTTWTRLSGFTTRYGNPPSTSWPPVSTMTSCSDTSSTSNKHWTSTGIRVSTPQSSSKSTAIVPAVSPTLIMTTPCHSTGISPPSASSWTDTDHDRTSTHIDPSTHWHSAPTIAGPSVSVPVVHPTMIVSTPCASASMPPSPSSPSLTDTIIGAHPGTAPVSVSGPMPSVTTVCPHDKGHGTPGCGQPSMTTHSSQDGVLTVTVTTTTTIICDTVLGH
ncbi:LysM peptidoglycan-binding domain-containing protein [Aspergillus affinis]|uniref:LysM peptidoglycan-binding domain-containing protein n=1 Tax=Aspergillus affinis TaxID=1070780 RepID=UPI0022FE35C1|nr:uncharacterized protein KD926_006735 [Aspergillus affinis]KAI9041497.1 hypothetical protein KD926_006735 [Aspergillus affinis]